MTEKNFTKEVAKTTDNTPAVGVKVKVEERKIQLQVDDSLKITGFNKDAEDIILCATVSAAGQTLSAEEMEAKAKQIFSAMEELRPQDGFEGMLISQMLTVYDKAMECFSLSTLESNKRSVDIRDLLIKQGAKLMRLFNQQVETLDKHRNKGRQKMTVEHIHIYQGGQAVIGNVQGGKK
jgi:hypothetical protein